MTKDLALLPTGSIDSYISAAYQIPVLTADEERDLAERLRDHGDMDAARRLVMSHLRFVIRVARGYLGYGLPLPDLIQEGSVGLMKAVRRFEPDVGVRLVSFAVHWIRAEIPNTFCVTGVSSKWRRQRHNANSSSTCVVEKNVWGGFPARKCSELPKSWA